MESRQGNYQLLISKLDQFTRKFYINKLIRGGLYTIGLLLGLFLLFNILEYYFYFDTGVRKAMFGTYIVTALAAIGGWVILPMTKYLGLGKTISHEQAAQIIGEHFGDVKDRLLNVLQLKKQSESMPNADLISASIDQKTDSIKLVPFKAAIDLTKNRQYLKYAVPPVLALLFIVFAAPSIIKDGTHRLINNNQKFEKAAPFAFMLEETDLKVVQYEDFDLLVNVEGSVLPAEAYIEIDNFQYRLTKKNQDTYGYIFRNVQKDTPFRIFSGAVSSPEQVLTVLAKPSLADFSVKLDYPSYTGRKDEVLDNVGDLVVPEGTTARWTFNTLNTDNVKMAFSSASADLLEAQRATDARFSYTKKLKKNDYYKVFITNENVPKGDSVSYALNVIKDEYPTISVQEFKDSLERGVVYFVGNASDDYGLSSLTFNYSITNEKGGSRAPQTIKVGSLSARESDYSHTFDMTALELQPGDNVSYYFEVKDNDAVNGSKSAKTGTMTFAKPTIEEFKEQEDLNEDAIKKNLKDANKNLDKLQEKFKKMREKLLQEKELDWQDKKELEKLLEEQEKLNEQMQKAKEKFDQNLENQKEFQKPSEQVQEKQEKLQQMFEEALSPEKQELLQKIQEMMQELNKENALEMMEQMEMDNETLDKEMDRLEELYKQLEMEKDVNELTEELEKLAEEQEKLAEKTEKEEAPKEQLKEEQEKLNEKMEELEKEMQELEKKNEELTPPKNLGDDNQEQMDDIQEDMEESQEQMDSEDSKGASESQKSAAKKMKQMASGLQSSMQGGEQEQQEEDIKVIRQLLENLVSLSFDQEDLVDELKITNTVTPRYVDLLQEQFKLKDDFKLVEDSLTALATRNDKIEGYVLEKVADIKMDMKKGIKELEERKVPQASDFQRRTMTSVNDLALMLEESMQNMQESMSSSMPGSQQCEKPGGKGKGKSGKVPSDKITEGNKSVGEKLKGMMEKQKGGGKNSAKDFAEAAAKQAAMRKALQDLKKDAQEQGQGIGELEEMIEQMNKIETDLVNKRLDGELLKRQQDITTRLLEAEKAARQREYDNKRKAEVGSDKKRELPPSLQEYLKKREAEVEMYKSVSPALRPYYKSLVDQYYKALKSGH